MKLYKLTPQKKAAQAMVEFAIVLPILLLLLYGLLETGRLLFIYSTAVNASRQAVRYGAATGNGDGGVPGGNAGVARYKDCAGIRAAANRADFLNAFDHLSTAVEIRWDTGPSTTQTAICPVGAATDTSTFAATETNHRLVVIVKSDFKPLVPLIVKGLMQRTITAQSARTILAGISIQDPNSNTNGNANGNATPPVLSLVISADPTAYLLGDTIQYTFTLSASGGTVTGPFTITATQSNGVTSAPLAVNCSPTIPPITPTTTPSPTCTATYIITSDDFSAGSVLTTAQAQASGGIAANATVTVTAAHPALSIAKSASVSSAYVDDPIVYTFTLTNSGNVPLSPPYTVSDDKIGAINCGSGDLAAGASITCSATYTVIAGHVVNSNVRNTATATAMYRTVPVNSDPSTPAIVDVPINADVQFRLVLTVTPVPTTVSAPGTLQYVYTIRNGGTGILTGPYSLAASIAGCSFPEGDLARRETRTCTGSYTVTQTDIDTKPSIPNTATAQIGTVQSNTVPISVTISRVPSVLSMTVTASPNPATSGNVIYTYTLTNSAGNVSLTSPTINDPVASNITCSPTTIPPGQMTTCTGTHPVSAADIEVGTIPGRTVSASASFGLETYTASATVGAVTTFTGPRLKLEIIANPTTYPTTGQTILYTYKLTNTGSTDLKTFSVVTNRGTVDCSTMVATLPSGASDTCVGSANASGPPGSTFVNNATAKAYWTGTQGAQQISSNAATVTVSNPLPNPLPVCSASAIRYSGSTMSIDITNPYPDIALPIGNIEVTWNHDKGRSGGAGGLGRALALTGAKWGSNPTFWPVPPATISISTAPPYTIAATNPVQTIPAGTTPTTLTFTFDNNYVNQDGTEKVRITTPYCLNNLIQSP